MIITYLYCLNVASRCLWFVAALSIVAALAGAIEGKMPDDSRDIELYTKVLKPLFQTRCFSCHGALKQHANLRLDTVASMKEGGDSGSVFDGRDETQSLLWQRVSTQDSALRMPPEHEGELLNASQLQTLREWIRSGAPAPSEEEAEPSPDQHWSFQPVERLVLEGDVNPIDRLIELELAAKGLTPLPEADTHTLIRRAYFDLIGMLPRHPEQRVWLEKAKVDPDWYAKMVEMLINDPRYGERWGRHWMDVWRYSDWWGLGDQLRNSHKHIWHWRDWIVQALNRDVPYDAMLRSMLAADELTPNDLEQLPALGYLARNYFLFNRHQWMDETVEHVGKGMMGLTFNCAKCHDHKYDPISQEEYYGLRAIFETYQVRTEMLPKEIDLEKDGLPVAFDSDPQAKTWLFIRGDENRPDKSRAILPQVPSMFRFGKLDVVPLELPREASRPQMRPWVIANHRSASERRMAQARTALGEAERLLGAWESQAMKEAGAGVASEVMLELVRVSELDSDVALRQWLERMDQLDEVTRRGLVARQSWVVCHAEWHAALAEQQLIEAKWQAELDDGRQGAFAENVRCCEQQYEVALAGKRVAMCVQDLVVKSEGREAKVAGFLEARKSQRTRRDTAPVGQGYTALLGAAWQPTRFLNSTQDDPAPVGQTTSSGRRAAFARWLTDRRHPLTARVAVNHIWMRHFGAPLVDPVFDFGRKGKSPKQRVLLDWLAGELMEHDWSMKHVHRLIMNSRAYRRQSSQSTDLLQAQRDELNDYYWKRVPIKMESQVVRDALLYWADELDLTMGGPPVLPAEQLQSKRRSLYFFHSNNDRSMFLTTFDEALVKECYRREQSIVPQQALALSNSALVNAMAPKMAARLRRDYSDSASESVARTNHDQDSRHWIEKATEEILGRVASEAEMGVCMKAWQEWRAEAPEVDPLEPLVWVLINHHDMITIP